MEKKVYKFTNRKGSTIQFFRIDRENDKVEVATEVDGNLLNMTFRINIEQYEKELLKWKRDGYTVEDITENYF